MFEDIFFDLRYAWRSLRRSPAFTVVAVLILTLGIGVTTSLFTLFDRVVIKALPYPHPDRLVVVHEVLPKSVTTLSPVNAAHFEEWRAAARSFDDMALLFPVWFTLTGTSEPERVDAARASASLFRILGARILHGRLFTDEEDSLGQNSVVVLGYDIWVRRFGGDRAIVGQPIRLDGELYTVVGVLAPGFDVSNVSRLYPITVEAVHPQMWTPLGLRPSERTPGQGFKFASIARLRPQVTAAQAISELNSLQGEIGRRLPGHVALEASVVSLHEQITGGSRKGLELLLATAAIVLLVACVNIANLSLTRATGRRHELAIQHAVGASRERLLRQLLGESLTIAATSGLLGALISPALIRLIVICAPVDLPPVDAIAVDSRVLAFTALVSFICAVVLGLLPAWRSSYAAMSGLKSASKGMGSGPERRTGLMFIALEAGASTACVIVAGVLAASLANVLSVDKGFDQDRIVSGELQLPASRYDLERASTFLRTLRERVGSIPNVVSVGISDRVPLSGEGGNSPIAPEGTNVPRLKRPIASLQLADGAYFRTLGIPIVDGRVFEESDRQRAPVAVVAAAAARSIWPGQNPVGKRFRIGPDTSPLIEIIGVVGDVRGVSLEIGPRPSVYLPYWHTFIGQASLTVRTSGDSSALLPVLRGAIRQLDPEMAVPSFESIDHIVSRSLTTRRFQVELAILFALTALVLTSLGLYSALTSTIRRRRSEIAVRMALGAKPAAIRWTVVVHALMPVAIGMGAGVAVAAFGISPLLRGLLFGTSTSDPRVIGLTVMVLGSVSFAASYVPAIRASTINPIIAMRSE
jgi:putative ABC transport system permease protein